MLDKDTRHIWNLKLYCDPRIGGRPRYYLAEEPERLMFVPDEVRKCVVYVGYRLPDGGMSLQGTAFLVARYLEDINKSFNHLVTAAHVIRGIESKENFDGKILVRANFKDGNAYTMESDVGAWKFHPEESEVDVAVLPFVVPLVEAADVKSIGVEMFLNEAKRSEEQISVGDEVFLTGLFYNHAGRARNIPIVRVGNIAAMPEEKVRTKLGFIDAYLIEARSIGGISGSPVFVALSMDRVLPKGSLFVATGKRGLTFYFLGLMHGHYDVDLLSQDTLDSEARKREAVNMGIAIVVPAEKVLEVVQQPMIKDIEEKAEAAIREQQLPTPDSASEEGPTITHEAFEEALRRASRKVPSPDEVKGEK